MNRRSSGLLSKPSQTTALILLRRDFFSAGDSTSLKEEDVAGDSDAEATVSGPLVYFMANRGQGLQEDY